MVRGSSLSWHMHALPSAQLNIMNEALRSCAPKGVAEERVPLKGVVGSSRRAVADPSGGQSRPKT